MCLTDMQVLAAMLRDRLAQQKPEPATTPVAAITR